MNRSVTSPSELGLKHLEGKSFDAVTLWLERALRGMEPLPLVVPDESPEDPILRRERELSEIVRQDLREACRRLVRRYVHHPKDDDDYAVALLHLAKGFNLTDVVPILHKLAADTEAFAKLSVVQIKAVLFTLLDLRAPLPLEFWKSMASGLPGTLSVIAVSGLLRHGYESALRVLPSLPNDQSVADSLYVILDQHAERLNRTEIGKMARKANLVAVECSPEIGLALKEWADAYAADQALPATTFASSRLRLESALAACAARRNQKFELQPSSARLVPPPAPRAA